MATASPGKCSGSAIPDCRYGFPGAGPETRGPTSGVDQCPDQCAPLARQVRWNHDSERKTKTAPTAGPKEWRSMKTTRARRVRRAVWSAAIGGRRRGNRPRGWSQRRGRGPRVRQCQSGRAHCWRPRPRHRRGGGGLLPGAALRRSAGREPAVAAPAARGGLVRCPGRHAVRAELPAGTDGQPVAPARDDQRGLPVPQRLCAAGRQQRSRRPAGAGVDPRRRPGPGRRPRLRRHQARGGRRGGRHDQLPPRRARLPGASGARLPTARPGTTA